MHYLFSHISHSHNQHEFIVIMPDSLTNIFQQTVEQILRYVEAEKTVGHIPQPLFLIGSFGSGKTTILTELAKKLQENGFNGLIQLFDGKEFFSSNDIIKAIEGSGYDGSQPLKNNDGRRRIVIIDDLDFFFNRSSFDDQYLLRNYLYQPEAPMLICALPKVTDALTSYQAPFFEGVRIIYVPSITSDSILKSYTPATEKTKRLSTLLDYLPPVIRSVKIATDIINMSENSDNDLKELINIYAPIYRIKFESLPIYSQKVLIALAKSDGPLTLSQLREITDIPAGNLSPYLRQLARTQEIRKTDAEKRGAPYEIPDKLFKLWLTNGQP